MPEIGWGDYLSFVQERHRVYIRRRLGLPQPWTDDPVLAREAFTNVYRVLDRGSQFLLKVLQDPNTTPVDKVAQAFLYRYTNKPEPWQMFYDGHGHWPTAGNLPAVREYWLHLREAGVPLFGNAYTMFSGAENPGVTRIGWVLDMTEKELLPAAPKIVGAGSLEERVKLLQTVRRCGPFMGMQIATDLGYTDELATDENDYVVAGPGSIRGTQHVSPGSPPESVIAQAQPQLEALGISLADFYRPPSLMDVQNTFCEYSKYVRRRAKGKLKNYTPRYAVPEPVYPNHWRHHA